MVDINGPAMVIVYVGTILIAILGYPVVASLWLVLGFAWLVYLGQKSYD